MCKKYLVVLDLQKNKKLCGRIFSSFTEKAFLTNAELFIVSDGTSEAQNYFSFLMRTVYCGTCKVKLLNKNELTTQEIFNQINYFVYTDIEAEKIFLDCAVKNDIKVIDVTKEKNIFEDIDIPSEVEQNKADMENTFRNQILKNFPPINYEYILFHEGLGESTAFYFWLKEYRNKSHKKILLICFQDSREELFKNNPYIEIVIKCSLPFFDFISIYYAKKHNIKRVLTAHFSEKILKNKLFHQPYGIIEIMRDFLGINKKKIFKRYHVNVPEKNIDNAKKIFSEMNLTQSKTVLILTEGLYFNNLKHHNNFWIKLAERLKSLDYEVVTNSQKKILPNCRNVFLSLFDTVAFVGLCGNIVTVPSGFFECICSMNTVDKIKLQFIFPNKDDIYWRDKKVNVEKMIEDYNFYLDRYFDSNIEYNCCQWETDDNKLIESLTDKLFSV